MSASLLETARQYLADGFSVLPIKPDGSKAPQLPAWKPFQQRRATDDQLRAWFGGAAVRGIALVHGVVSGNSEVLDFDEVGLYDRFAALGAGHGLADLLERIPLIETPSGGRHLLFRCAEPVEGNQKLARDPAGRALIETRGEGGYTLAPGSPAVCHPEKREYRKLRAGPVPVLSAEEHRGLLGLARAFDAYEDEPPRFIEEPGRTYQEQAPASTRSSTAPSYSSPPGLRPGDDFNERGDPLPLLQDDGWRVLQAHGQGCTLRRPGKTDGSISATWNYNGHRCLKVFTSNAPPFEPDRSYRPFSIYHLLRHNGDAAAAARELGNQGYGEQTRSAGPRRPGPSEKNPWPTPLAEEAYHGLAGEIVRAIGPHTESDPAALLFSLLVGFGNLIGRGPYYRVESTRHHPNLFACIVGSSSSGRKGTAWNNIRSLFQAVEPSWADDRIKSGLSSGEGFIHAVRDGRDPGEDDKRLLVFESEMATVLKVIEREGNTLSARLRDAWDTGNLSTLTRKDPQKATGAHVSIVAQITQGELERLLSETEQANGFANRFLWVSSRRSKLLPDGGNFSDVQRAPLVARLKGAADFAADVSELTRDEAARTIWHRVYPKLTGDVPGLLGAVTSRAAPQVLRLSILYALLDRSRIISAEHLTAAIAAWEYAEASCRYIFGEATGDAVADALRTALRLAGEAGLTRSYITRDLFHRNQSAERVDHALALLAQAGIAYSELRPGEGIRPTEFWFAAG